MRDVQGFRFEGLDLGSEARVLADHAGLMVTPAGRLATVSGGAAVRQAILLLLTTRPGERVMRPDYGCLLHRLMFAPNDPTTAGLAIHYVRQALTRWEPRIEITRLDAGPAPDDGRLTITLEYRLRASGGREFLELDLDLQGELV
jgi:uncharacterized protein